MTTVWSLELTITADSKVSRRQISEAVDDMIALADLTLLGSECPKMQIVAPSLPEFEGV